MSTIEQRLGRIEHKLSKVLLKVPEPERARISEKEAIARFGVSQSWLKKLRLGYVNKGIEHAPVLFKWGHIRGRRIDYDVAELEQHFKREYITT